ncbi:hypothetical protein AKJ40_03315 [candidate division MSBL1 archaeon SCGC-AAA259M10]|uniref:Uncharacterized protein n=1 Tax=candidate division MSBL1 archaeon SCGC-AAA259M10 TaxID=1698270 RepID=A0A133UYV5_9EURY|nr:hypothetical protein AKJ40_03315 [candidate division MSBL1 archaeon SCGC-AAA259M10]
MVKEDDPFYDLICYIATSARGCVEEPKIYGSFRLIETMERVINILEEEGYADDFYLNLRDKINDERNRKTRCFQ